MPSKVAIIGQEWKHEFIPSKNEHTEECKANNGIKPENAVHLENESDIKIKDIGSDFKMRCADMALEKNWLQPLKIWETVRDEMVAPYAHGVVISSSEQVS